MVASFPLGQIVATPGALAALAARGRTAYNSRVMMKGAAAETGYEVFAGGGGQSPDGRIRRDGA